MHYKALDDRLKKFKVRNGLRIKKQCGGRGAAATSRENEWKEEKLKLMLSDFVSENTFCAEE